MKKFRKKPVIIEAEQWFKKGDVPEAPLNMLDQDAEWRCSSCGNTASKHANCKTLEGYHIVCHGDWIVKGVNGEHYPVKPDIFEKTYEEAEFAENKQEWLNRNEEGYAEIGLGDKVFQREVIIRITAKMREEEQFAPIVKEMLEKKIDIIKNRTSLPETGFIFNGKNCTLNWLAMSSFAEDDTNGIS